MDIDAPVAFTPRQLGKLYFSPQMKRKATAAGVSTKRKGKKKKARISNTQQIAMRTGGWANPVSGSELKFVDVTIASAPAFGSAAFAAGVLLNGLVPGSGANERIGRKVIMTSLLARFTSNLAATTTLGCCFRYLIVYDKQANATAPAITDILDTDNFLARMNLSNRDRFVVLVDKITPPVSVQGNHAVASKIYRKNLNLEVCFNAGNAGTVADITSGSVYFFAAQSGQAATANLVVAGRTRIRYKD